MLKKHFTHSAAKRTFETEKNAIVKITMVEQKQKSAAKCKIQLHWEWHLTTICGVLRDAQQYASHSIIQLWWEQREKKNPLSVACVRNFLTHQADDHRHFLSLILRSVSAWESTEGKFESHERKCRMFFLPCRGNFNIFPLLFILFLLFAANAQFPPDIPHRKSISIIISNIYTHFLWIKYLHERFIQADFLSCNKKNSSESARRDRPYLSPTVCIKTFSLFA